MDYMEWNYRQAKRQAAKLEEQAERLERLAEDQMEGTLGTLSCNWSGKNSGEYLRKGVQMKNEISALSRELCRTASVICSSAERIYRAEMRARELARKREY